MSRQRDTPDVERKRRHPPSPTIVLDRLERDFRNRVSLEAGDVVLWLRLAAIRTRLGGIALAYHRRAPAAAVEALSDRDRTELADALRNLADELEPTPTTGKGGTVPDAQTPPVVTDEMIDRAVQALLDGPFHAVQRVSDDTMRSWVRTALVAAFTSSEPTTPRTQEHPMPEQTSTPIGDLPDPRAGHPDRARVATASPLPIGALSAFATPKLEALVADAVGILQERGADLSVLRELLDAGLDSDDRGRE